MRIDSAGNIGIGTASPGYKFDIVGGVSDILRVTNTSASGYEEIKMTVGTQSARIVLTGQSFGDANYGTGDLTIQAQTAGKGIRFGTNGGVNQMILDSAGLLTLASGQIKFPASQNASADANTLDDYEEGSWTPVVTGTSTAGSATYTSQQGNYVKIGRYVFLQMFVVFTSAHTGTGGTKVGGFPFTITNSFGHGGTITYKTAWVTNGPDFMQGEASTNFGYLRYDTNTSQADITPNVNIQNTTGFMLSIWYLSDN
jgi:hypothetical protein